MRVYLGLDQKCISPGKILNGRLGGTERRFMNLMRYLVDAGHSVSYAADPGIKRFDVAVHSNTYYPGVCATRHIQWAGSWHCDPNDYPYDKVVFVSEFMASHYPNCASVVVPACFDPDVLPHRTSRYVRHRVVSTSNPNRYMVHAVRICKILDRLGVQAEWLFCGGNKLYAETFPECFSQKGHRRLKYRGVLDRTDALRLISSAHVFAYPNFTDNSETFGLAPVEAAALGVPVLVADRQPFREVLGADATYAENEDAFARAIKATFKLPARGTYDMSRYSTDVVMPKIVNIIEGED